MRLFVPGRLFGRFSSVSMSGFMWACKVACVRLFVPGRLFERVRCADLDAESG